MADLHHVYVTAHGEWTSSSWANEKAQMGFRLPVAAEASLPAKGSIFTPVANGAVVQDSGTQAGTNGTLTRTWTARLGPTGSPDNADATNQADLGDDVWSFLNGIKDRNHPQFRWTHVKIAPIAEDGSYAAPSAIYQFTTPIVGTGTGSIAPPQVAIAMSLRAGIIGRRGRGRMYLPGLAISSTFDTVGKVSSATISDLISNLQTLVTNVENLPGTEEYTYVVSVMSAGSATAVRPSEVRVGDIFDTQRRRTSQEPEVYTVGAL